VILFSLRFFFQFIQLSLLVVRNGIANYQGYHLVFIDRRCSPFSFFNIIFVDKKEIQNIKPDIRILRGIGGGCDEEAIRVVKMMPKWIPGEHRGTKVDVQFNLPIKFKFQEKSVPGQEKKTN